MKVEQIYTGCLAEAAYYIESNGEAIIIDPLRETKPYLEKLQSTGAKLKYIFETHFHADFVSGHVDLARETGAKIVYGPTAKTEFDSYIAKDGEIIELGNVKLKVLHTPGHTMESTTYLLFDEKGEEYAIFTGDTLFIGDVGRPDLAQKSGEITMEDLAGWLYDSLREKIMTLHDDVIVYPAHGAGSACGKNMSDDTWDTLGHQKRFNYALRADMTRDEFIKEVTEGLLPPPQYFAKNAAMNKKGYAQIDKVIAQGSRGLTPEEVLREVEENEALVLDVRSKLEYTYEHIPGSIFIGLDGTFAPWVGSLIPDINQAIILVAPEGREEEAVTRLSRVGYDNCIGYLKGGMESWKKSEKETDKVDFISSEDFVEAVKEGSINSILDNRRPTEFLSQKVEGAVNFPLDYINKNMHKLDKSKRYYLYCASGFRSLITASILKSRGFHNVIDVHGGFKAVEALQDSPVTEYVCPTTISQEVLDKALVEVT